jgi:hypothetical protein
MSDNEIVTNNKKYQKEHKKNIWGSPYPFHETLGWLVRNGIGPSKKNSRFSQCIPKKGILNPNIATKYTICAIGDIMDMRGSDLSIGSNLKSYVSKLDSDTTFYLGNFEATLTEMKSATIYQRHKPQIIEALTELFPAMRTYLSVANNHAGDFEPSIFHDSIKQLQDAGFHIIGLKANPSIMISSEISVTTGTQWSNLNCDLIPNLDVIGHNENINDEKRLNILYPHWGFEMELYPRPKTITLAKEYLFQHGYTAIFGHHTHCYQPITLLSKNEEISSNSDLKTEENIDNDKRLVGFSLGDFCTGLKIEKYRHGIFLKIGFGKSRSGEFMLTQWEWNLIKCERKNSSLCEVDFQD